MTFKKTMPPTMRRVMSKHKQIGWLITILYAVDMVNYLTRTQRTAEFCLHH